jgi:LPXTG-motif cell wall-anchored protein
MKKLALAFIAASCLVFGMGQVATAQYGQSATLTPANPTAGQVFTVVYGNCFSGETITFTFNGVTVNVVCANIITSLQLGMILPMQAATGTASTQFTAPTAPGTYPGTARGNQSQVTVNFQVVIPAQATTTTIPATTIPPGTVPGGGAATTIPPATVPGSGLPATGSNSSGPTTLIALALFGVGVGLFVVAQVRRRPPTTA